MLERESEQIDDVVHQFLMGSAESALAARREPQSPVHAGALPNGADDARVRRAVNGVDLRGGITNEMPGDLNVAAFASGVQHERIGATESKHVEALEWNRLAERSGHTGNHFAKAWRFRDQTRNRRQHVHRISLYHYWIHFRNTAGSSSGARASGRDPPV